MNRIAHIVVAFLRWLFSPELLQAPGPPGGDSRRRPRHFTNWLLAGGDLPARTPGPGPGEGQRFSAAWLVAPERLPERRSKPDTRRGFLTWVLGPELLRAPERRQDRPVSRIGPLRRVLSPETCPALRPAPPPPRRRFLAWVLRPEVCPVEPDRPRPREAGFVRWLLSGDEL